MQGLGKPGVHQYTKMGGGGIFDDYDLTSSGQTNNQKNHLGYVDRAQNVPPDASNYSQMPRPSGDSQPAGHLMGQYAAHEGI